MSSTADAPALRHVIVVGGTLDEWATMSAEQWADQLAELGKVTDHVGASWLTVRPYGGSSAVDVPERSLQVGHCLVVAHPQADGRARIAQAVTALQSDGSAITEAAIAQWCGTQLAGHQRPREMRRAAAIPRGGTGKISRREIRSLYTEDRL